MSHERPDILRLLVPDGTTLEPTALDGVYPLRDSRALECAAVLLRLRPDSTLYLTLSPGTGTAVIAGADPAPDGEERIGSGFRFLLEVLVSLINGRPTDLRGVQALDGLSMAAFGGMMRAYWRQAAE